MRTIDKVQNILKNRTKNVDEKIITVLETLAEVLDNLEDRILMLEAKNIKLK